MRAATAALLAAASALTAQVSNAQVMQPKPYDPAIVRVVGRAELYLPPDQARISAGFYNPGRTAQEATDAAARRANALTAAIRGIDPAKVVVERSQVTVQPVMKAGGDRRPDKIAGYEARANLTVLVKDLDTLSRAVEATVNSAPDNFSDVDFSIKDTDTARRKAREAAVKDAVDKAKVYVEGAGFRLGRLLQVQEGGGMAIAQSGNRAVLRSAMEMSSADSVTAPVIAAEPQLYTAEVEIVYEIGAAAAPR